MTERRLDNVRYVIRSDLSRRSAGGVQCPLGVFPVEKDAELLEGYETRYQTSEDEFGDQFEYRVLVSADRLSAAVKMFFEDLLPDEVYALYEEFSFDAYRETDAYMSDDVLPRERVQNAWDLFGHYFVEDGKCGFGAMSYEPAIEIFVEEHGSVFIAAGLEKRAAVEICIEKLGLCQFETLKTIDNFRHQHRDILVVDPNEADLMDEVDIKFSIIASFGMKPSNLAEGEPAPVPCMYWAMVEFDLSFSEKSRGLGSGATMTLGFTAEDHDAALKTIDSETLRIPGSLVARVVDLYRIKEEDLTDEIAPRRRDDLTKSGVWHRGELQYWG